MMNMAITTSQLIVDKVIRVTGRDRVSAEPYFITGQVSDPSLQCDAQEVIKNDAEGTPIAKWMNAKTAQFSGAETFWNLDLFSQQLNGEDKTIGTTGNGVIVPLTDPIKTYSSTDTLTTYVLAKPAANVGTEAVPEYKITVCKLNKDGSIKNGGKFTLTTGSVAAGKFTYDSTTHTLTFQEGAIAVGDRLFVQYDYNSEDCVAIFDSADKFPKNMEMVVEVICHPVCDPNEAIAGYAIFPNAQLSASVTENLGRTDTFPFSFSAQQEYCDESKQLFRLVFPTISD